MSRTVLGREFAVAAVVAAVGAGALLLACGQAWATASLKLAGIPGSEQAVDGRTLAPGAFAFGLAGLAGIVGLVATRHWLRRVVAVIVTCCGAGAGFFAWRGTGAAAVRDALPGSGGAGPVAVEVTAWPWVAVAGSALVLAFGIVATIRGPLWPGMGRKYDAPRPAADSETDMWRALDHGEDPTA
ncbi:MAG: Trp biosynthesis-associated membrane protein [Streptosporangiales bacterium]